MNISNAIAIAARWADDYADPLVGAFVGGSTAKANPGDELTPGQDIDLYLLVPCQAPTGKLGKTECEGVLLDISYLEQESLTAAIVEDHSVLTSLLHFGHIVRDTDHALATLQGQVSANFHVPERISARLTDMSGRIIGGLQQDNSTLPHPEQVMNWLFPATLTTHLPLIQACQPLTVRKRFLAAQKVLDPGVYEELLACFGWASISSAQAQAWLDETEAIFDASTGLARSSNRFWAGDLRPESRVIAIDGSQRLINDGWHREALYWIIATSARCLVLHQDHGVEAGAFDRSFHEMLIAMSLATIEDRLTAGERLVQWMDRHFPIHT